MHDGPLQYECRALAVQSDTPEESQPGLPPRKYLRAIFNAWHVLLSRHQPNFNSININNSWQINRCQSPMQTPHVVA